MVEMFLTTAPRDQGLEIEMKEFTESGVTYSKKQTLNNGVQYQARYKDGQAAWAFIAGKKHTRKQVIESINEVNERSSSNDEGND